MLEFKNVLMWKKLVGKKRKEDSFTCPYCNFKVKSFADVQLYDDELGMIKYHIFKCNECYMPVIIDKDKKILPPSQLLPFEKVRYLPDSIEKLYDECRKSFANYCYCSVIMVARTLLMHIAVDKGDKAGRKFVEYLDFFANHGFIGTENRGWVDRIRTIGNKYTHELDEATAEDAEKVIIFIKQLLGNIYEMPVLARQEGVSNGN